MEGDPGGGSCPNLLDLLPDASGWSEKDGRKNGYGVAEEQKLELRLGLPGGENWRAATVQKEEAPSALSLGLLPVRASKPSSDDRAAASPVVGWPPIRSFRKNLASGSSKQASHPSQNEIPEPSEAKEGCRKPKLVKVNMDGVPIGRKIDLVSRGSYDELASAVDELFRGLLAAQANGVPDVGGDRSYGDRREAVSGMFDGSGEYTLVYEDNEGDVLLVGDVPWDMFVAAARRLRVLKSSELSSSLSMTVVRGKRRAAAVVR